jgi:hypothetical protein
VENLALKVGQIHRVAVHQAQAPNSGRGEIQQGGRADASGPHHQNPAGAPASLSFPTHLGQEGVPGIALGLLGGKIHPGFSSSLLDAVGGWEITPPYLIKHKLQSSNNLGVGVFRSNPESVALTEFRYLDNS